MSTEVSRRSFLKLAAATGAAAAIPGCKPAARHLVPYVLPQEDQIPGMPTFYASTCGECPAACGVVGRVRDGRVIKLEGNPADPIGAGTLCARGQAALEGLYNPDRLTRPSVRGADRLLHPVSWESAMSQFTKALAKATGAGSDRIAFISPSLGPTYNGLVDQWMSAVNSKTRLIYEPIDYAANKEAIGYCFGADYTPHYHIDRARVLITFGADFIETWRSPVELMRSYAAFHTPAKEGAGTRMGLSYYVGPRMSLTASRCDHWFDCRPGFEAAVALAVLRVIVDQGMVKSGSGLDQAALKQFVAPYDPAKVATMAGVSAQAIEKMAKDFAAADGALAIAGTQESAAHVATWILNAATGNLGKTVELLPPEPSDVTTSVERRGEIVRAMHDGSIDVAVITRSNPVFTSPQEAQFAEALRKVPTVVWLGNVPDETAEFAHLLLPIHHWIEDWSDAEPRPGVHSLRQPLMTRVVYSRSLGDVLLESARTAAPAAAPTAKDSQQAVKTTWSQLQQSHGVSGPFQHFWDNALREGGWRQEVAAVKAGLQPSALQTPVALPEAPEPSALTMVAYPHIFFYDGRGANKPWLQEVPEPVTQLVWDNWVEIHPDTAKRLDVVEGDVVQISSQAAPGNSIKLPVHVTKFVHPAALGVPIGQGHTSYGRYAINRGANPWPMLSAGRYTLAVKVMRTGSREKLVSPSFSSNMMGRPIVEVMDYHDYEAGIPPKPFEEPYKEPWEIYPAEEFPVHKWGMTIDLNACTGCSACVVACYAENNVAVVGKEQVNRGRQMSWIRIERYIPETTDAPLMYMMPMLCQQCDHAPCEPVCPVFASSHNDQGLNLQVYNRCIGTRYCENNCPYKVRKFNWYAPHWDTPLNLQLNPDVTVRGAGVMEKCTFCIQRIRSAEIVAKVDKRELRDGEIVPACAETCPAHAITFGDTKHPDFEVNRRRKENEIREYRALNLLNVRPNVGYLRQVYRTRGEV